MDERFEGILAEKVIMPNGTLEFYSIIKDKVTGVLYLASTKGGLTVMLDKDGKPLTR